jgi:hypothetical protein
LDQHHDIRVKALAQHVIQHVFFDGDSRQAAASGTVVVDGAHLESNFPTLDASLLQTKVLDVGMVIQGP